MLLTIKLLDWAQSCARSFKRQHETERRHGLCYHTIPADAMKGGEGLSTCDARLPGEAHGGHISRVGGSRPFCDIYFNLGSCERELIRSLNCKPRPPVCEPGAQPAAARELLHGLGDGEVGSARAQFIKAVESCSCPCIQPCLNTVDAQRRGKLLPDTRNRLVCAHRDPHRRRRQTPGVSHIRLHKGDRVGASIAESIPQTANQDRIKDVVGRCKEESIDIEGLPRSHQ
mmetsp:Transcript_36439/g.96109  ORF Transcript_36439/g.96109 Transcript_36439/m.96109 type:complete len:229 (+) Transcript_36439:1825-2511(+)